MNAAGAGLVTGPPVAAGGGATSGAFGSGPPPHAATKKDARMNEPERTRDVYIEFIHQPWPVLPTLNSSRGTAKRRRASRRFETRGAAGLGRSPK